MMAAMRMIFFVRTDHSGSVGDNEVEERVMDRLAEALGPEMSVLTIGRQYFHDRMGCEGHADPAEGCA
jgi:hypothetical protein